MIIVYKWEQLSSSVSSVLGGFKNKVVWAYDQSGQYHTTRDIGGDFLVLIKGHYIPN